MTEVNTSSQPDKPGRHGGGRKPLDPRERRVQLAVRVNPSTKEYLESQITPDSPHSSVGRSLDALVKRVSREEMLGDQAVKKSKRAEATPATAPDEGTASSE